MSDATQQQLREAYNLIKAKQRQEAVAILLPILQIDEDNANAWWLLANALTKPDDAREALENVLRLKPDHANAQNMLEKLNERYPPPLPEPEPDVYGSDDSGSDPFGGSADAFGGSADVFGGSADTAAGDSTADPFGGSADVFGAGSSSADPFGSGDPFAVDATPEPALRSRAGGVADSGDPFDVLDRKPLPPKDAPTPSTKKGRNPLVIILAVVGVVAICGCIGCGVLTLSSGFLAEQFFNTYGDELLSELEGMDFESLGGLTTQVQRGGINYGETKSDRLGSGEQHTWTFNGNGGDNVTIEMSAPASGDVDPYLYLYDTNGNVIAEDDDSGVNLNSRISYSLPSSGTYTIGVQSFGGFSSGSYELRLNR